MKWSLQQLRSAKNRSLLFDEQIQLDHLKEDHDEIRAISPFHLKGRAEIIQSLVTVTYQLKGTLTLPCARTLVDVDYPLELQVTEKFYPSNEFVHDEDEDAHFYDGDIIDLSEALRERILLEIPMQVYADDVEVPLAPEQGEGWEIVDEESKKNQIDPRLAGLAKFFEKE